MLLFIARISCVPLAAALALGAAALPASIGAQALPPYATPASGLPTSGETIHGVIQAVLGPYRILVRDDRGFVDDVTLRHGTVINPRGVRLAVGMTVTISGFASGSTFSANEIDAPYQYDGAASGSTYYNGYPGYDYGYGYGYGSYDAGFPGEFVIVVGQPVVVQPPSVASPPPGARRTIEPPRFRRPLERRDVPAVIPSYAAPPTAYRAAAPAPAYRAPAPEYHAPPPPEFRAPPPAPPRSEPAPARENHPPPSNGKPH
jgi:hypothetical protein